MREGEKLHEDFRVMAEENVNTKKRFKKFKFMTSSQKTDNVVIIIILLIIILLMSFSWNHRYGLFLFSLFMLAFGTVIQEGWQKKKRFRTAILVVAIPIGGLVLTRAWNLNDNYEQKEAIMLAVVRDWKINSQVLKFPKFTATDDETLSEKFSFAYPRFYSGSFGQAISSGLFKDKNSKDAETLRVIYAYSVGLTKLNHKLDLTDQTLFVGLGRNSLEEWRKVRKSYELKEFTKLHDELEKLLERDGWLEQEKFIKEPDVTEPVYELHEKVGVILKHDPNTTIKSLVLNIDSLALNIDEWTVLRQWHTKISDMLKLEGYFERNCITTEWHLETLRLIFNEIGLVLEATSTSTEDTYILNRDICKKIVWCYGSITVILRYDRWRTKELYILQLE